MECNLSQDERDKKRFQKIASSLPFLRGTIIAEDGTTVDISDLFEVETSPADPQITKAQTFTPYVKDKILLQDGRVCSLLDIIGSLQERIRESGIVYSDELRLSYVPISWEDWGDCVDKNIPSLDKLDFAPYELKEEDWKWL